MHPDAVIESHVDARTRIVDVPTAEADQGYASSRTSSSAARHSGTAIAPAPRSTNSPEGR